MPDPSMLLLRLGASAYRLDEANRAIHFARSDLDQVLIRCERPDVPPAVAEELRRIRDRLAGAEADAFDTAN